MDHDDDERRRARRAPTDLVVDAANTVGSRPDGWWRDRAGAAGRLLSQLELLAAPRPGASSVTGPDGAPLDLGDVHAVLEGAARAASPEGVRGGVHVHLAPADGDARIAELAADLVGRGRGVLVVTADLGLRARLPEAARAAGPGWLRDQLDQLGRSGQPGGE